MKNEKGPHRIEFFRHSLTRTERAAAARVLRGVFLSSGPQVAALEEEFAAFLGVPFAVAVASCSQALLLTLRALDIGEGDEVLTTPMSYVATANAILHAGATPVFVDVEADTGNLDAAQLAAAVTARTRAVLPVHLYGHMCDMPAIAAVAARHDLAVVEDSAHCIEGQRDGLRPAERGTAACFSFYATKNVTGGEGGMIVTGSRELAKRIRRLRGHGVDRDAFSRHGDLYAHYDIAELGYKANLSDINAALIRPQLARVDQLRRRRERLARRYERAFAGLPEVETLAVRPGTTSARHLLTILVPPEARDETLWRLQEAGIGVAVNYRPIHLMRFYRERFGFAPGMYPHAERIGARTVTLPLYPKLTYREQDRVIAAVHAVFGLAQE